MLEHLRVHGRREEHGRTRREIQRRQEIVRDSVGELANDVRCGRRDDEQPDAGGERDVLDIGIRAARELIRDHRPSRNRFERQLAHEPPRRAGHDRSDLVAAFLQPPRDFDCLVGANSAGYAESD